MRITTRLEKQDLVNAISQYLGLRDVKISVDIHKNFWNDDVWADVEYQKHKENKVRA